MSPLPLFPVVPVLPESPLPVFPVVPVLPELPLVPDEPEPWPLVPLLPVVVLPPPPTGAAPPEADDTGIVVVVVDGGVVVDVLVGVVAVVVVVVVEVPFALAAGVVGPVPTTVRTAVGVTPAPWGDDVLATMAPPWAAKVLAADSGPVPPD